MVKNIHVGMVAGKMNSTATIKNVISASHIHLGNEAIGTVYVGGIVGSGSGVIKKCCQC